MTNVNVLVVQIWIINISIFQIDNQYGRGKRSQIVPIPEKGHPRIQTRRRVTLTFESIFKYRDGMQPKVDLQTKLITLKMEKSIQSLVPVDISLLSIRWNEESVLRLHEDNFNESTDLIIYEEVKFSCRYNGTFLGNKLGSIQNVRRVESDPPLWCSY